jgi:hypothetical protein
MHDILGDFNATASLVDVFVTLHGILCGTNTALSSTFSKKSPPIPPPPPHHRHDYHDQQPIYSELRTPHAAPRKEAADSFLSSRSSPLLMSHHPSSRASKSFFCRSGGSVIMSGARRSRGRVSAVSDSSSEVFIRTASAAPHFCR